MYVIAFSLPDLVNMKTCRKYRLRRVSEILKTLDTVDAMLHFGSLTPEKAVESEGFFCTMPRPCKGKDDILFPTGVDDDAGVTRLSANVLMKSFPSDQRGRCSVVYKRRQSGRLSAILAEAQMMTSVVGDGEGENQWIVVPHPLEWYGEALHIPLEVLAMFPDV
ncbi:hypothetical protein Hanom_Chr11g01041431 [Helianthus anomalus]